MKYRLGLLLFCFTISGLTLGGCAALKKGRRVEESPEARLGKIFLERALEYERKNQPHKALQSYEAALAVIVAKKEGLEDSLRKSAEKHYRRGLELEDQGKYGKARHEFLTALRLWPDFPEVVALLKPLQPKPHTRYVLHRVGEGEFLTTIAQKYYNDQSKFGIIARFNDLEDATKLSAGMKLKIPEIEGVIFSPAARSQTAITTSGNKADEKSAAGFVAPAAEDSAITREQEMGYDQVAIYQEQGVSLLEAGQYLAALHEFQKVLNTDPTRKQVREYMAWAHYRQGEVLFNHAQYLGARTHFQKALRFDEDWTACKEYVKRSEDAYKEVHYLKGIQYFEEERLREAIEAWQVVNDMDPNYKQVQNHLLRAQKLLEKVKELKESP
ncbi:MAG: LysM peptidoglycan-binding domain-containing protein [Deltaproteobacteria bacterium]|nr:MAG: LysM peptidoglycan-binding domain-containing protein [Deltaproteobacteria bacterium]